MSKSNKIISKNSKKHSSSSFKRIVGRTTRIDITEMGIFNHPAKVDTGAWSSSLHAEEIVLTEKNGQKVLSFYPISTQHKKITVKDFEIKNVKSSFGDIEQRYCVYLQVSRQGKTEKTLFNLTNRSSQRSKILLGRLFLKKFELVVDVTKRAKRKAETK